MYPGPEFPFQIRFTKADTDDGQRLARHAAVTVGRRWPIIVNLAELASRTQCMFGAVPSSRYTNQTHLRVH